MLSGARRGESGALVLRGEAGMGKSALLAYAATAGRIAEMMVLGVTGVEWESDLAFAGLHGLLWPIVDELEGVPEPQREPLAAALGLAPGEGRDRPVGDHLDGAARIPPAVPLRRARRRRGGCPRRSLRRGLERTPTVPALGRAVSKPGGPRAVGSLPGPVDESGAEEHFARAIELAPALSPFDEGRSELLYGEWLRRRRRRIDARRHLRSALERFGRLGTAPWETRARAELRASGETARRRDPSTRDQLTPQELQIARLVTTGKTNPEVAAQLFLSPRTIDYHLRKVFAKLEIASRAELADLDLGEPATA